MLLGRSAVDDEQMNPIACSWKLIYLWISAGSSPETVTKSDMTEGSPFGRLRNSPKDSYGGLTRT